MVIFIPIVLSNLGKKGIRVLEGLVYGWVDGLYLGGEDWLRALDSLWLHHGYPWLLKSHLVGLTWDKERVISNLGGTVALSLLH